MSNDDGLNEPWYDDARRVTRVLQCIVGAMCVGTLLFLIVALVIGQTMRWQGQPDLLPTILIVFIAFGLLVRAIVLHKTLLNARRGIASGAYDPSRMNPRINLPFLNVGEVGDSRSGDAQKYLAVFQVRTIISAAMAEGWAFFAVVVCVIDSSHVALGLAIACLFGVVLHFPTLGHVIRWVEQELALLKQTHDLPQDL
jgi:hypothetical protein